VKEFIPRATRFVDLPAEFLMRRGGVLHGGRIAYETVGRLNGIRDNAILLLTGLSPDAHVASHPEDPTPGWWETMVGPQRPIDTNRWHVICVNSLGSCKGSTGPASINPATGESYGIGFPDLSIEDISDTAAYAVRALGIERLACVIGASMGGMSSLALVARHPELTSNLVNISGAVHARPFAIALRSLQREAIQFDPNWNQGRYGHERYPSHGMVMARKLGLISYRSGAEWDARFGRTSIGEDLSGDQPKPLGLEFAIEGYLECHANRFARCFDPNAYLYLSRCIDRFDLGESCGYGADDALARLRLDRALVIGVETDILFPLPQQRQIADGLRGGGTEVTFLPLDSPFGHDAFLVDIERFGPPMTAFLSALSPKPSPRSSRSMLISV
jgi:homoserine O-acetyltransferase/serine/homoserine O-acetyltransferase